MTVSELIKELQKIKKYCGGDIKIVLSSDSEGNSYSTLDKSYSLVRDMEDSIICLYKGPQIKEKLMEQKVIGVCLFPFEEGYESAENAVTDRR